MSVRPTTVRTRIQPGTMEGVSSEQRRGPSVAERDVNTTSDLVFPRRGRRIRLATTRVTRDPHRLFRSPLFLPSPTPLKRTRVERLLRHTSSEPERTKIGKVVPIRGHHRDHASVGDNATASKDEA